MRYEIDTRHIKIADYDYPLPENRIAKFPLEHRDHSKLLLYMNGKISEDIFFNLPKYLPQNALMVFNNTRVIQARLHFRKQTGALIEVFLLEPVHPSDYELMFQQTSFCSWLCMVGNLKKWKEGELTRTITVDGKNLTLSARRRFSKGVSHWVDLAWDNPDVTFAELLEAVGELPIPPYLNRDTQESDLRTYQTVYSKKKGSVAAPTAGLHFTPEVLHAIDAFGIQRQEVTLHVGAGTFKPVKSMEIEGHDMHTEYFSVTCETIHQLLSHHANAIAVGTTSVRTLESLYYIGIKIIEHPEISVEDLHVKQWEPYNPVTSIISPEDALRALLHYLENNHLPVLHSSTQIIIAPGYEYKYVKALVTNFHQPQSTLLLLVSAFVNGHWHEIYDYALHHDFRFLSYGDSSLLIP